MSMLWLIHPEPAPRDALQASLQAVWPGVRIQGFSPETAPAEMPAHCVALAHQEMPQLPVGRLLVMGGTAQPPRLKTLALQLQDMLRRTYWPSLLKLGDCALDTRSREWICPNGGAVTLTEKEIGILVYLWQREQAATREDLLRDVWSYAAGVDTHTIETHMYRLRQKIEADPGDPRILMTAKDGYLLAATRKA